MIEYEAENNVFFFLLIHGLSLNLILNLYLYLHLVWKVPLKLQQSTKLIIIIFLNCLLYKMWNNVWKMLITMSQNQKWHLELTYFVLNSKTVHLLSWMMKKIRESSHLRSWMFAISTWKKWLKGLIDSKWLHKICYFFTFLPLLLWSRRSHVEQKPERSIIIPTVLAHISRAVVDLY